MTRAPSSVARLRASAVVVDASAVVEALLGTAAGVGVRARMRGCELHAPAHLDAEVLSALGRLHRGGELAAQDVAAVLAELAAAPIRRHELAALLSRAWDARDQFRLVDALYVELAGSLGSLPLLTTDRRFARATALAELIEPPS
jgi:predicted nucleic acid-binding protein